LIATNVANSVAIGLSKVLECIDHALSLEFKSLKLNVVIIKGLNDNEVLDFVNFVKDKKMTVRFIEYMPFEGMKFTNYLIVLSESYLR
jgi:molybdenum cofactor biosynthesis enzyme MoaA